MYSILSDQSYSRTDDLTTLWNWIKSTIKKFRHISSELNDTKERLKLEKIRNSHDIRRGVNDFSKNEYEEFCRLIMEDQRLEDFDTLRNYIVNLINNNNRNKQEIQEMKKLFNHRDI